MSNKDNLLNENTIKRFMRLSSLNDFTDRFLDKVEEIEALQEEADAAEERHGKEDEPDPDAPEPHDVKAEHDGEPRVKGLEAAEEQVNESVSGKAALLSEQPLPGEEEEEAPAPAVGEEAPLEGEEDVEGVGDLGELEAALGEDDPAAPAPVDDKGDKVEKYIAGLVTYAVETANEMFDLGLELDLDDEPEEGPEEELPPMEAEGGMPEPVEAEGLPPEPMPEEEEPPMPPMGEGVEDVSDTLVDQVLKRVTRRLQEMAASQTE